MIARKPKGIGMELKSLACGDTKCIIALEMHEGRDRQAQKHFEQFGAGCAFVLRLASGYFGTKRTIVADSAFASVNTLEQCRLRGLFFMGMVKTAHKRYPKEYFQTWFHNGMSRTPRMERGEHLALQSTIKCYNHVCPVYAIAWADKKIKMVVTNRGTTLPGTPSVRERHRVVEDAISRRTDRYQLEVKRPQAIELYFKYCNVIDYHDHLRQGSLRLEEYWKTKKWWHRVFAVIFGIIVTNSYLAYKYESTGGGLLGDENIMDFNTFIEKLAYKLVFNPFLDTAVRTRLSNEQQFTVLSTVSPIPSTGTIYTITVYFTF